MPQPIDVVLADKRQKDTSGSIGNVSRGGTVVSSAPPPAPVAKPSRRAGGNVMPVYEGVDPQMSGDRDEPFDNPLPGDVLVSTGPGSVVTVPASIDYPKTGADNTNDDDDVTVDAEGNVFHPAKEIQNEINKADTQTKSNAAGEAPITMYPKLEETVYPGMTETEIADAKKIAYLQQLVDIAKYTNAGREYDRQAVRGIMNAEMIMRGLGPQVKEVPRVVYDTQNYIKAMAPYREEGVAATQMLYGSAFYDKVSSKGGADAHTIEIDEVSHKKQSEFEKMAKKPFDPFSNVNLGKLNITNAQYVNRTMV